MAVSSVGGAFSIDSHYSALISVTNSGAITGQAYVGGAGCTVYNTGSMAEVFLSGGLYDGRGGVLHGRAEDHQARGRGHDQGDAQERLRVELLAQQQIERQGEDDLHEPDHGHAGRRARGEGPGQEQLADGRGHAQGVLHRGEAMEVHVVLGFDPIDGLLGSGWPSLAQRGPGERRQRFVSSLLRASADGEVSGHSSRSRVIALLQ